MRFSTRLIASAYVVILLPACTADATSPERAGPAANVSTASALNVFIDGPWETLTVRCTWTAFVSGGTPPYTYQWSYEFMTSAGADNLQYWSGTKDGGVHGYLRVDVYDALGQHDYEFRWIATATAYDGDWVQYCRRW